jgi:hypothetical protein
MYPVPIYLKNYQLVRTAFGFWPSFHDANVEDFRYAPEGDGRIDLTLHGFVITDETDDRGYFILVKHHLVHFAFHGILEPVFERFMENGNILFDLGFSFPEEFESKGAFKVNMESAMGGDLDGAFLARYGEVVEVIPCDAEGNVPAN